MNSTDKDVTQIDYRSQQPSQPDAQSRVLKFKNLTDRQKSLIQSSAAGFGGLSLGVLGVMLMGAQNPDDSNKKIEPHNAVEVTIHSDAPFSEEVNDQMSFAKAFETAREDVGPGGFFEWRGQTYNTYYKEEWEAMDDEDKSKFFASIDYKHQDAEIDSEDDITKILNDDYNDHEDIVVIDQDPAQINTYDPDSESISIIDDDIEIIDDNPSSNVQEDFAASDHDNFESDHDNFIDSDDLG